MDTLKIGLIGCGNIANVHSRVIAENDNAVLTTLCDTDDNSISIIEQNYLDCLSQQNRKKHHCIEHIKDWHKMCDMDVNIVHLCTPHFLHVPMAVELLRAGKAVFMEKPCAINYEQFEELNEADSKFPGKLGICFQNRYNKSTQLVDELIQNESIGKIIGARAFVTWRRDNDYYTSSTWKGRLKTEGGGALINQSIHTLDLLLRYLGEPQKVNATICNHHLDDTIEVEDTVEAWLEYEDGKRACFYCSNGYSNDAPVIIEIQGENGRITINGGLVTLHNDDGIHHYNGDSGKGLVKDYWGIGHKKCIDEYYQCIGKGVLPVTNLKSAENTFITMMKIYESGRLI